MLELLIGQIPEAIYFALFLIFAKKLKTHRLVFFITILIEYLLLKYSFPFSWYFHIGLIFMMYLTLKLIYKERSQITDVFIILVSFIYLWLASMITYLLFARIYPNIVTAAIVNRLIIFIPLLILNYRLNYIQKLYKKYWNRNSIPKKIKSITFRSINIVMFNMLFVILNLGVVYAIFINNIIGR